MNEHQMIWETVRDDVARKVMEWLCKTAYKDHSKVRHIVIMEPGFSLDVQEGIRVSMAHTPMMFDPAYDPGNGPRFPGCTFLWSYEGVEYYADGTGKVGKWEVIVGARRDIIDLHTAPYLPKSKIDEAKGVMGISVVWGNKPSWHGQGLYEQVMQEEMAKQQPLYGGPQFTFMGEKFAQFVKLGGNGVTVEQWAIENPCRYMVCESCGNVTGRNAPLDTLMCCHYCHGYRFNCDTEAVTTAAKRILASRTP